MIVYVVARRPGAVVSFIQGLSLYQDGSVQLHARASVPSPRGGQEQVVTIIDLSDPPEGIRPPPVSNDPRVLYILLVDRRHSVPFPWVEFARSDAVRLIGFATDSPEPFAPVGIVLAHMDSHLSPQRLAQGVVQLEPRLRDLEDLARTLLSRPWRIRRPADLARAAQLREAEINQRCEVVGLMRLEHFMTLVRGLAFEFLTEFEGLSAARARFVVGVSDASNFRRQRGRLRYFSRAS